MDSPEPANNISSAATAISASATASSDSPVQESPFSNFLSSLSPINSVKAAHVPQGFLGLSSPPLVFTSPRTILHQRTSFLQRSQLSHISSFETPEKDDGSKKLQNCSDDLKEPETYCRALIDDIEEDNDIKKNTQDQPGSLSGCAEYLNDSGDCINSASSIEQNVKQSNDILQSSISSLSIANSDEKSHSRAEVDTSSALFEPIKENLQGQSYNEIKPLYIEEDQIKSNHPHNESDSPINHDHEINQCDVSGSRANEEYVENMKTTLQGSIQSVAQCNLEVSQLQRGLSRRCLQFEEAGRKTDVTSLPCSNQRGSDIGSKSPTYATEMESLGSTHVDLTASSSKKQMLNLSELANSAFPPHSTGKSNMVVSKPSGIGLHLNSIALPVGSHSSLVAIKSTPTMNSHHVDSKGYSEKLSKLVEKVAIAPGDDMHEPLSSLARSAVNSEPCQTVKPLHTAEANEHHVTPLNKRNFNLEHADNFEDFSQLSPTKKKRKISSSADGDGCKRCNCKKTKCVKLYCDCFAAGIYCAESCACQGCFNKPEHEDTVMETRQLIESRNPLAFAPKVVQRVAECATFIKEDGSRAISSLARHKRGCNCKKSVCLKKYCECYQANVGCSSECRCEGCRNSYGRKEEYHASEEILHNRVCKESSGGRDEHKLGMTATNKSFLQAELQDPHNLTSSTPSFQHSDHVKDAAKFQSISSRYAPSPESDFSNVPSYVRPLRSPRNSLSNNMIPEGNEETLNMDCFDREMDDNVLEMMDQFSSRCNAQADMCDLTPSQNSSITTLASSASSKTKGHVSNSRFQLCSGNGHFSSVRSLRWRSSPLSPMPQLGGTKNDNDSDSGLYDILGDETPEILKEASTPIASVKATSPNKKRVSPPHNHIHGLRPSSSVGLRSGRKFILTAISSPSPLTRCDKSKGDTDEKSCNS